MKINGIRSGDSIPRGERMSKKQDKSSPLKKDSLELSPEGLEKQGLERTGKGVRTKAAGRTEGTGTTVSKPADTYQPGRAGAELPIRTEKVEHAKMMIKKNGYDDPQVLAAIIDRLVFALKE